MVHRKFSAPRHGPTDVEHYNEKAKRWNRLPIKVFPKDNRRKGVRMTAFIGYKVGLTYVVRVREVKRPGSRMRRKEEVVEAVTIIETPRMIVVGLVGYIDTPEGLRMFKTVWAEPPSFVTEASLKSQDDYWKTEMKKDLKMIKTNCSVVRIIAKSQRRLKNGRQTKAKLLEIQLNGGSMKYKVEWARRHLGKPIPINKVFEQDEMINAIGMTKIKGVTSRWQTKKLQRKTHMGLRRVACIGAWHPSRVDRGYQEFTTEINKKIYRIGEGVHSQDGGATKSNSSTECSLNDKPIIPRSGFPKYGVVNEDFIILRGTVVGRTKGVIVLRKSLVAQTKKKAKRMAREKTHLMSHGDFQAYGDFQASDDQQPCMSILVQTKTEAIAKVNRNSIDPSRKVGHGRFQGRRDNEPFMGPPSMDI